MREEKTMNRFAAVFALALIWSAASAADAQYYTTYYSPATTVYYSAPAPVVYYAPPVPRPVAYTAYYAPAPAVVVPQPVVYYRPVRPLLPRRWNW
jgi:hypothetical protein